LNPQTLPCVERALQRDGGGTQTGANNTAVRANAGTSSKLAAWAMSLLSARIERASAAMQTYLAGRELLTAQSVEEALASSPGV